MNKMGSMCVGCIGKYWGEGYDMQGLHECLGRIMPLTWLPPQEELGRMLVSSHSWSLFDDGEAILLL